MNKYTARLDRLRLRMGQQNVQGMILVPGASMRYLCGFSEPGFERLLALIVPADHPPLFIAPALNGDQVRDNPAGITDVRLWEDSAGWETLLREVAQELSFQGVLALSDEMPARFTVPLMPMVPAATWSLASELIVPLRSVKDEDEMELMQRAAEATDHLLPALYSGCRLEVTEAAAAQLILNGIAAKGHEAAFDPIVAAGANGARPHHHTSKKPLMHGDIVILDFGVRIGGYCGDITRAVALGSASEEAKRVYQTVYAAYQAGLAAVQPGATGEDVDAAARRVIEDAGFGEYFIHRTGHGIGLDDHEPPFIVAGNKTPLQPGECFSIEPGIYLPGQFGVRLENIVTVQADGTARVLNEPIPAELPVLSTS